MNVANLIEYKLQERGEVVFELAEDTKWLVPPLSRFVLLR
jgi:hypothetical protein